MTPGTLESIRTLLSEWEEIDLPHIVGERHPDQKLADLNFADFDGRYFINLSSRVRKQFEEEFSDHVTQCYPNSFTSLHLTSIDSNQNYTLDAVIRTYVSSLQSQDFALAARHLRVMVQYQMANGFWDRSKRKVHHPGSIGVSNMLEELAAAKSQLDTTTANFRDQLSTLQQSYDSLKEQIDEIPTLHSSATSTESKITALHEEAVEQLTTIKETVASAEKEEAAIEANRKTIDQFTQKITNRETQLEKQEKATNDYLSKLTKMEEAHISSEETFKQYVGDSKELIESLIKEATLALELNTARGLSKEFQTKAAALKPTLGFTFKKSWFPFKPHGNGSGWWLFGSGVFIAFSIFIAIALIAGEVTLWGIELKFQNDAWHQMVGRLSIVGLLVTASVFCAKQFTKARNLYEDYAYRQILTSSLPAFLKQLEEFADSESMGAQYLQQVLEEVKTHPTRELAKNEDKANGLNLGKDQIDLLKSIITSFNTK